MVYVVNSFRSKIGFLMPIVCQNPDRDHSVGLDRQEYPNILFDFQAQSHVSTKKFNLIALSNPSGVSTPLEQLSPPTSHL